MTPQEITILLYNLTLIPVTFFSFLFFLIAIINIFSEKSKTYPYSNKMPFITVQIPVFNDDVAAECIEKCLKFDYPKNKYEIIIADDSTDKRISEKLKRYALHPQVKYFHRNTREGFKPGALQNVLKHSKGEIIVVFDSDWKPGKDFLKRIIQPILADRKVAIVQAKQTFVNLEKNLVSRFAGYLLTIYYSIMMPINNKFNTVFFCGTAGAIRKDILLKAGGWNAKSITEDADLSVKVLSLGYKSVFINYAVPSEVPVSLEAFIRQQMRWCYGLTRAFFDNRRIIFGSKLKLSQKLMISYLTLGNIVAPVVLLMTLFGMASWFLGEPQFLNLRDIIVFLSRFFYTSGFLVLGAIALKKERSLKEFPYLILGSFSISILVLTFNTFAFFMAVSNKPLYWYRTPKAGNILAQG